MTSEMLAMTTELQSHTLGDCIIAWHQASNNIEYLHNCLISARSADKIASLNLELSNAIANHNQLIGKICNNHTIYSA